MDIIKAIDTEFPHIDVIHLNHAGIGPWPMRSVRAICDFANENARHGAMHAVHWSKHSSELRTMLADLIHAPSNNEISFVKNTSEALSLIAYGIDWQSTDNIVVGMQEFPSNRVVWESLENMQSVEVRVVDLYAPTTPEQALIKATDKHTRLISTSSVQYATGYRMDLDLLGHYCHPRNILFCVDAIQSLGAAPVDVQDSHIDFLAADAHKWLLAPEGIALFYCKSSRISELKLNQYGWHTLENDHNYDALYNESRKLTWCIRSGAKRFECGSPNQLGIYALRASLSLLMEIGINEVYQRVNENINYLAERIDRNRYTLLTPDAVHHRAGILTIKALKQDNKALFDHLIAHKIFCAYRGGGIRLSPHFYNATEDLDIVLDLVHEYS